MTWNDDTLDLLAYFFVQLTKKEFSQIIHSSSESSSEPTTDDRDWRDGTTAPYDGGITRGPSPPLPSLPPTSDAQSLPSPPLPTDLPSRIPEPTFYSRIPEPRPTFPTEFETIPGVLTGKPSEIPEPKPTDYFETLPSKSTMEYVSTDSQLTKGNPEDGIQSEGTCYAFYYVCNYHYILTAKLKVYTSCEI